jgi:hypothetical protein
MRVLCQERVAIGAYEPVTVALPARSTGTFKTALMLDRSSLAKCNAFSAAT